jgi:hypothetical protein
MNSLAKKKPLAIGFVGENAYGILEAGTCHVNHILGDYGIEAHCIHLMKSDWAQQLRDLMVDRAVQFCYGFAGVGAVLRNESRSFWTDYKIPFLSLMYDHPFANLQNHIVDSPYVSNCYFVADYAEVQLNYIRHVHQCFVMRDAIRASRQPSPDPQNDWHNREISYLFIKTGHDVARLTPYIERLSSAKRKVFDTCLDLLQQSADYHLTHVAADHCRAQGIDPHEQHKDFAEVVLLLDRYLRDWRSRRVVEWLKYKPAVIIGDGWDMIDKTGARAQFLSSRPAGECASFYAKSRFVLNSNPYFRDGCHERVLMALQSGAVAVSDRNRFSDHIFKPLDGFVGFDWADRNWQEHLDDRIAGIDDTGYHHDPQKIWRHLQTEFSAERLVFSLLAAAQKIRANAEDDTP